MSRLTKHLLTSILLSLGLASWGALPGQTADRSADTTYNGEMASQAHNDEATRGQVAEAYGKLPLSFEANHGQTAPQVKFVSRGSGYNLFLTANEAVLAMRKGNAKNQGAALKVKFVGANGEPKITGEGELSGKSNYLIGDNPDQWRTNIGNYAKVKYDDVYPGIDMVYYGNGRQLEYDFIVAPGADLNRIKLSLEGAQSMRLDDGGDLVMNVGGGEIRQRKPFVYQEVNGVNKEVTAEYALSGNNQVGFKVAEYDESKPLVIDPVLVYSTFLGGSGVDIARGIAVDHYGDAYVTGQTSSLNFPTTAGSFQTINGGVNDVFVAKLNKTGSALVYSTYLGGSVNDAGFSIEVDAEGRAYVTGSTSSPNFPTTAGALQTVPGGSTDAFLSKLNSTGAALVYSTYLGGNDVDDGAGIALHHNGEVSVTGQTESINFPITAGAAQATLGGASDAYVAKVNTTGTALVFSTYIGGSGPDAGRGIADRFGSIYVAGQTSSLNFPTTAGAFQTAIGGLTDAFVAKLNPTGTALVYSTYLGGAGADNGLAIAVSAFEHAFVTGNTSSVNFPTTAGAFQTVRGGGADAFVTKINTTGAALDYSTYLGGGGNDFGQGIDVRAGRANVTGSTSSSNFPTTADAIQGTIGGLNDAFVTRLNVAGSELRFSTFLGGPSSDAGQGIALLPGQIVVVGSAQAGFPTTTGAFQGANAGSTDAFVLKIKMH